MQSPWLIHGSLIAAGLLLPGLLLMAQNCQAGLSGRSDTLMTLDNREFQDKSGLEERLDLNYDHQASGLSSGLSLGLRQRDAEDEGYVYQLYLDKKLGNSGSAVRLGRFEQADSLGFYTLDGVRCRLAGDLTSLLLYSGVPRRIEGLRSVEGESVSGADLHLHEQTWGTFALDGRIGWQVFEQQGKTERMNVGLKARSTDTSRRNGEPFSLSLAGSWLADEKVWESYQLNLSTILGDDARLQLDYETYEPAAEVLSFRDRFYSNYESGRQSQGRAALHLNTRGRNNWSFSGRQVERESGDSGYGQAINWLHRDGRGMRFEAQLDRLVLREDQATSFYMEMRKPMSTHTRTVLGGVWQQQEKKLAGDNNAVGVELRLERIFNIEAASSGLLFTSQLSHIWNSRLDDEYRIALGLSYRFNDHTPGAGQ